MFVGEYVLAILAMRPTSSSEKRYLIRRKYCVKLVKFLSNGKDFSALVVDVD
ncbi:MAG TPA: hypothetical protein VFV86_08785 [Nitrososphaeraceae archaeon]|nr:hypothetical protein [Nitrososphaeraceae archaeon]